MTKALLVLTLLFAIPVWGQSLTATQSGPSPTYVVGATSTITVQVINSGAVAAASATLQDAVPAGMDLVSTSGASWSCAPASQNDPVGNIICTYSGTIPASGGISSSLSLNLRPRKIVASTSPTNFAAVDPSGGAAPPAAATCTAFNTPSTGCAPPLSSAVPAANSLVWLGPQSNVGSLVMNNIVTNCEHYDLRFAHSGARF